MRKFTDMQLKFIANKAQGLNNKQAGLIAGFAPNSISVTVAKLMARPEVKKAIAKARKDLGKKADTVEIVKPMLKDKYENPLDLFKHVMNNKDVPFGMRFEAAKQALPYCHARVGEKGKKEHKDESAKKVASGGRFSPKKPPQLSVVR